MAPALLGANLQMSGDRVMGLDDGEECYIHTVDIQNLKHCGRLGTAFYPVGALKQIPLSTLGFDVVWS